MAADVLDQPEDGGAGLVRRKLRPLLVARHEELRLAIADTASPQEVAGSRGHYDDSYSTALPACTSWSRHPRATRGRLSLPALDATRLGMEEIREKVLERLARTEFDLTNPLLAGGYVYHTVLQHEYQHNETILQTLQLNSPLRCLLVAR